MTAFLTLEKKPATAEQISVAISADAEEVFHIGRHLAANNPKIEWKSGRSAALDTFAFRA